MIAVVLLVVAGGLGNASFEEPGETPPGWTVGVGATNAPNGPASTVGIDGTVARDGKASLRLEGDAGTMIWRMLSQTVPVRPGDRVTLSVATRCRNLRREGKQYGSDHAVLVFHAANGKRLGLVGSAALEADREWADIHAQGLAPPHAATVQAGVLLTMSGTLWLDDVRLVIAPTDPLDEKARAAALEALRLHLDRSYPFFGVPGKPGPGELPADPANADFAAALRAMLLPLRDVHIWIDGPKGRVYTAGANPNPLNANLAAVRRRLTKVEAESGPHLVGRVGEVGYARIGSFELQHQEWVETALDKLDDARHLVLDVRTNGGGHEDFAMRIASRFAETEIVYVKGQGRDRSLPGLGGFHPPVTRSFGPVPGRKPDLRRVIVLQGPYAVSSTEAFLLMMRKLERVTTLGLPSRGSMGNPRPFALTPEYSLWIPTRRELTPEGAEIEGLGVAPEVRFEAPRAAYLAGDPTFEKALELLEK